MFVPHNGLVLILTLHHSLQGSSSNMLFGITNRYQKCMWINLVSGLESSAFPCVDSIDLDLCMRWSCITSVIVVTGSRVTARPSFDTFLTRVFMVSWQIVVLVCIDRVAGADVHVPWFRACGTRHPSACSVYGPHVSGIHHGPQWWQRMKWLPPFLIAPSGVMLQGNSPPWQNFWKNILCEVQSWKLWIPHFEEFMGEDI